MNIGFRIPNKVDAESPQRIFDLRQYLNFVWRNWAFIVSVTTFVLLIGLIHLVRATPLYTATTQVLLQAEKSPAPTESGSTDYYRPDFSFIENQLAILKSDSLLRRVVIKERIAVPPPGARESQSADGDEPTSDENQAMVNTINMLRGALEVSRSGKGQVLSISITWEDPTRAAQLANAVADAYVLDQLDA